MTRDQEIAMVKDCQQGDMKALDTLVRQLQTPVYNAAYRMLGSADEAADVTQTTFLKVFENLHRFDPKYRLFSWTYRIAVNEAVDQLRRRKRVKPLQDPPKSDTDQPQEMAAASQLSREVQATLMELNEDQRAVIVLHYFSDCSYKDIGHILDLPEKTVKSRLFAARQHLKNKLQGRGVFSS
ncbi:MAG: sigma-70 family RNA polymerase sigma factor [Proteobacteria bacterium]|nr:sigma-70 family RNA polymerase sigma factor [Pseudomonadota bacterium]